MPDWDFAFCGPTEQGLVAWKSLLRHPNVKYHGFKDPEYVRQLSSKATVGLIPFTRNRFIHISLPLKAFEYVAAGLPVVSVPIEALTKAPEIFSIASNAAEFAEAMRGVQGSRWDHQALNRRREIAQTYDYGARFQQLIDWIEQYKQYKVATRDLGVRLKVLVLYDPGSTHVATLHEHLVSLRVFSSHDVHFSPATGMVRLGVDLAIFDVVVLHYSIRVSLSDHLSPYVARSLSEYGGLKVLFIQDEYDTTETARRWIERLCVQVVYTCIPVDQVQSVYPNTRFPYVEFIPTLTGYVPWKPLRRLRPLAQRKLLIAYRGRALPFWYGALGQEKMIIGKRMREICDARGLPVDIEWEDDKRIYGPKWYEFLESARATLGTESGSNILDETGSIRAAIESALLHNPDLTYEEAQSQFLGEHEGRIRMNQVSPKIFEAISCRTALILFEGAYSRVIEPDLHFIPLKKDFSNVDEVLTKVSDLDFVEEITTRAFDDVIASGRYSYQNFVADFDASLTARVRTSNEGTVVATLTAIRRDIEVEGAWDSLARSVDRAALPTSLPLSTEDQASLLRSRGEPRGWFLLQKTWRLFPATLRRRMAPISSRAKHVLSRAWKR